MKRITITLFVLLTVCCLLIGCTPNEESSAETYKLPALVTGENGEIVDPSDTDARVPGEEKSETGSASGTESGSVETAPADNSISTEQNNTSGSINPDDLSPTERTDTVNTENTDQPSEVTTDSSESYTVNDSEEVLSPRDTDPNSEDHDPAEGVPVTDAPVQAPIDTEDPNMVVESDYEYVPSGEIGIGGN